jgi:hypothetical protein
MSKSLKLGGFFFMFFIIYLCLVANVKILALIRSSVQMRIIFFLYFSINDYFVFSNKFKTRNPKEDFGAKLRAPKARDTAKVATMDQYRFISIERDTTYLDTQRSRENTVLIICERITLDFGFRQ